MAQLNPEIITAKVILYRKQATHLFYHYFFNLTFLVTYFSFIVVTGSGFSLYVFGPETLFTNFLFTGVTG